MAWRRGGAKGVRQQARQRQKSGGRAVNMKNRKTSPGARRLRRGGKPAARSLRWRSACAAWRLNEDYRADDETEKRRETPRREENRRGVAQAGRKWRKDAADNAARRVFAAREAAHERVRATQTKMKAKNNRQLKSWAGQRKMAAWACVNGAQRSFALASGIARLADVLRVLRAPRAAWTRKYQVYLCESGK